MEGISGVGISFGADRIYDVLDQLKLFEELKVSSTQVMIVNFGKKETEYALNILDLLHGLNVGSELYPDASKLKKQISYADSKKIPYVIIAGEDEIRKRSVTIKIMSTGEQQHIPLNKLSAFVKKVLDL
jgi:histidyl-tRNA synthetase